MGNLRLLLVGRPRYGEHYLKLLNTYSMYRTLPAEVRQTLLNAIHDLIQALEGRQ